MRYVRALCPEPDSVVPYALPAVSRLPPCKRLERVNSGFQEANRPLGVGMLDVRAPEFLSEFLSFDHRGDSRCRGSSSSVTDGAAVLLCRNCGMAKRWRHKAKRPKWMPVGGRNVRTRPDCGHFPQNLPQKLVKNRPKRLRGNA